MLVYIVFYIYKLLITKLFIPTLSPYLYFFLQFISNNINNIPRTIESQLTNTSGDTPEVAITTPATVTTLIETPLMRSISVESPRESPTNITAVLRQRPVVDEIVTARHHVTEGNARPFVTSSPVSVTRNNHDDDDVTIKKDENIKYVEEPMTKAVGGDFKRRLRSNFKCCFSGSKRDHRVHLKNPLRRESSRRNSTKLQETIVQLDKPNGKLHDSKVKFGDVAIMTSQKSDEPPLCFPKGVVRFFIISLIKTFNSLNLKNSFEPYTLLRYINYVIKGILFYPVGL